MPGPSYDSGRRVMARTSWPSSISAGTSRLPMKPVAPVTRTVVMRVSLARHRARARSAQRLAARRASNRDMAGVAVTPCRSTEMTTVKATVDHSHDSPGTSWWLVA